jgi:hypothetical protein
MAVMAEKPAGDTTIRPFTSETPEADLYDLRHLDRVFRMLDPEPLEQTPSAAQA